MGDDSVFIDIDNILPGDEFIATIERTLDQCVVVIVVIGPRWLEIANEHGQRLNDSGDYHRLEIERALRRGIRVIPVLVGGAGMPAERRLPDSLKEFARRHAVSISGGRSFYPDTEGLARTIESEEKAREARERAAQEVAAEEQTSLRKELEDARANIEKERTARTQAEAQAEAERQLREEALKQAQREMETRLAEEEQLRAEAIKKAREEAESKARVEVEVRVEAERKAREEAEYRLQLERQAREDAERKGKLEIQARLEAERVAREEAEAKAADVAAASAAAERLMHEAASKPDSDAIQLRKEADKIAGTARRAHADAIARVKAEMDARIEAERQAAAHKRALATSEERAKVEIDARAKQERDARSRAEQEAMAKIEVDLKMREREEDARARAEYQKRAEMRAAQILAEKKAAKEADARARAERQQLAERELEATQLLTGESNTEEAATRVRPPLPWRRIAGAGAVALIALVVVGLLQIVPFPVASTERLLSDRLQEPVKIGSLHFAVFPSPHWKLQRLVIGAGEDVKIGEASVSAFPESSGDTRRLSEVQLSAVSFHQSAIGRMATWVSPQTGNQALRIDSLRASNIMLSIPDFRLPLFDATINLAEDGALKLVALHEPRMSVELTLVKPGEWTGKFRGKGWRSPIADGVEFSDLRGEVSLLRERIAISHVDGTLYGGSIKGDATVRLGNQLESEGQFELSGVDLGQLLPAMGSGFSASGSLDAKLRFASQGLRAIELFAAPTATATFAVRKGVLNNMDLLRALQSSSRGGKTPFDQITGEVHVTGNRFMYRNISLSNPALKASGAIDVLPNSDLSGRINAQVGSKTVTVTRGTLNLGGNLRNPVLSP